MYPFSIILKSRTNTGLWLNIRLQKPACVKKAVNSRISLALKHTAQVQCQLLPKLGRAEANANPSSLLCDSSPNTQFLFTWRFMASTLDQAHRRKKTNVKGKTNTHEATCTLSMVSEVFKTHLLLYEISTEDILKSAACLVKNTR